MPHIKVVVPDSVEDPDGFEDAVAATELIEQHMGGHFLFVKDNEIHYSVEERTDPSDVYAVGAMFVHRLSDQEAEIMMELKAYDSETAICGLTNHADPSFYI